jgi:hypothetical protein
MLKHSIADARYALRRLRARPGYTLLAVLTLALGIGGSAAVFGIARPLMFERCPYAQRARRRRSGCRLVDEEEFLHMRGRFPASAPWAPPPGDVTLREGDAPARLVPGCRCRRSCSTCSARGRRSAAASAGRRRAGPSRWR